MLKVALWANWGGLKKKVREGRRLGFVPQPNLVIFIYPVDDVVRIRTGDQGKEALTYEGGIDQR